MRGSLFTAAAILFSVAGTINADLTNNKCDTVPFELAARSYLMLGVDWVDLSGFNATLQDLGLDKFSSYGAALGWGWDMSINRFMSGGEIGGLFWKKNEMSDLRNSFWAARILYNTGFQVIHTERVSLYPLAGIGLGVSFFSSGPDNIDFSPAVRTPPLDFNAHQYSLALNLGCGLDFYGPRMGAGHRSPLIGIRAGYMFDPTRNSTWESKLTEVSNGPDPVLQGPYIRLELGKALHWKTTPREMMSRWHHE